MTKTTILRRPRNLARFISVAAGTFLLFSASVYGAELPAAAASLFPRTGQAVEVSAQDIARSEAASNRTWRRRWVISLAPFAASQVLDATSSYGLRELNPLLASSNGSFGMKAVGIKSGTVGAFAVAEYFLIKKYPRSAKFFTIVNFTTAGVTSGFAAHNFTLPRN